MTFPATYTVLWNGEKYRLDEPGGSLSCASSSSLASPAVIHALDPDADDTRPPTRGPRGHRLVEAANDRPVDVDDRLNLERNQAACIGLALIQAKGRQNLACRMLGVTPRTLNYTIKRYELTSLINIGRTADASIATDRLNEFMASYRRRGGVR